jgi:hypothetical protein
MQPAKHPLAPQPPLTPERPPTVEDLKDLPVPAARAAELAPAAPEPSPGSCEPRPDAPRVTAAPSSGTPVAQTPAAGQTAAAPATAGLSAAPAAPAAAQVPAPAATPRATRPAARKRLLTWNRVGFIALLVVLYLGWTLPTERYITPTRGLGYALGIIGGSLMLLLLVYSARKRIKWLRFLGPTAAWFRFHMMLGILGPLLILFHSNFKTGAANSNVALFCMLTVAASGFIGRYLYARVHRGLYGRKLELRELQASASGLRELSASVAFLPELVAELEVAEKRLLSCGPQLSLLGFLKPVVIGFAAARARWQLYRHIRLGLRAGARTSAVIAAESKRLCRTADDYIEKRLAATRRVAEFEGYERLFSLWHALHIPLIFMLIIAAVIHVIAVNVY